MLQTVPWATPSQPCRDGVPWTPARGGNQPGPPKTAQPRHGPSDHGNVLPLGHGKPCPSTMGYPMGLYHNSTRRRPCPPNKGQPRPGTDPWSESSTLCLTIHRLFTTASCMGGRTQPGLCLPPTPEQGTPFKNRVHRVPSAFAHITSFLLLNPPHHCPCNRVVGLSFCAPTTYLQGELHLQPLMHRLTVRAGGGYSDGCPHNPHWVAPQPIPCQNLQTYNHAPSCDKSMDSCNSSPHGSTLPQVRPVTFANTCLAQASSYNSLMG